MKKYILIFISLILTISLALAIYLNFFNEDDQAKALTAPMIKIYNNEGLEINVSLYEKIDSNEIHIHTYEIKKEDKILPIQITYETDIVTFILKARTANKIIDEYKFNMDKSYIGSDKTYDIYLKQKNDEIYFDK